MHGQRVEIWLNGVKINDYTSTRAIANGYIGVQNDGAGLDINYRNIRVKADGGPARADRHRPGQADHGVQCGGRQPHVAAERRRRQRRHPLGQRLRRPAVDHAWTWAAPYNLTRVRLDWETAYGRAYQIQTSPDNATWTTVYSTTTGDGGVDDVTVDRHRPVRADQRHPARPPSGATRCGTSTSTARRRRVPTLLRQGRPTAVSSVETGSGHVGANAVDGNAGTRWGSAYADPQWISSTSARRGRSAGSG